MILLFHQAAGAPGGVRSITRAVLGEGYNVVAADIRGGGGRFGFPPAGPAPADFDYCDAAGGGMWSTWRAQGSLTTALGQQLHGVARAPVAAVARPMSGLCWRSRPRRGS
jgi:hypothetical protein